MSFDLFHSDIFRIGVLQRSLTIGGYAAGNTHYFTNFHCSVKDMKDQYAFARNFTEKLIPFEKDHVLVFVAGLQDVHTSESIMGELVKVFA